jgi:hypothetical protein
VASLHSTGQLGHGVGDLHFWDSGSIALVMGAGGWRLRTGKDVLYIFIRLVWDSRRGGGGCRYGHYEVMRMMLTDGPGALDGGDLLWARLMRLFGADSKSNRKWGLGVIGRVALKQTTSRADGRVQAPGLVGRLSG